MFLQGVTQIGQAAADFLVMLFTTLAKLFVETTGTGENAVQTLTIFGQLLLFAAAVGLGIFVIEWIKNIVTLRRN